MPARGIPSRNTRAPSTNRMPIETRERSVARAATIASARARRTAIPAWTIARPRGLIWVDPGESIGPERWDHPQNQGNGGCDQQGGADDDETAGRSDAVCHIRLQVERDDGNPCPPAHALSGARIPQPN